MFSDLMIDYFNAAVMVVFIMASLLQLFVYLRYFLPFSTHHEPIYALDKQPLVSIVIAVKNETANLKANLPLILNQDYADFEIVIVDDHSSAEETAYLKSMQNKKIQLHQLYDEKGKKAAVKKGIQKARSDRLIFIDADCKPKTTLWLRLMSERLNKDKSIVLGHAPFLRMPTTLNKVIRYESFVTAIQYFSTAILGKAYMGVGRNLGYTKSVFEESKAFQNHEELISGDDDLLVNEMGRKVAVAVCTKPEAHCFSKAASTWKTYFHQKRRQLQAGERYRIVDRFRLAVFGSAQLFFWISFLYLMIYQLLIPILICIFVVKLIIQLILYKKMMSKLGEKDLLWYTPALEISYLFINIFVGLSIWIVKVDRWK